VPIIVVLGKKEEEEKLVSVRKLGDKHQEVLELSHFVDKLLDEIKQKRS
jgi:threonyl-tRNA synthetase